MVTYNEASVDYGLDSDGDDDVMYYQQEARIGEWYISWSVSDNHRQRKCR